MQLQDTSFWTGTPKLISVGVLRQRGLQVDFRRDAVRILKQNKTFYVAKRKSLGVFVVQYRAKQGVAFASRVVLHYRLNHCTQIKMKLALKNKTIVGDFSAESCVGCLNGKSHRKAIRKGVKENTFEPLELLAADTVEPYPCSIDRKTGDLIVTDVASVFVWAHPVFKKAEITPELISLITRVEREFPQRVKNVLTDNGTEFYNARCVQVSPSRLRSFMSMSSMAAQKF